MQRFTYLARTARPGSDPIRELALSALMAVAASHSVMAPVRRNLGQPPRGAGTHDPTAAEGQQQHTSSS